MSTANYLLEQLAAVRREVADLKRQQVSYRQAEVTAVDAAAATFDAAIPGEQDGRDLVGIPTTSHFLPNVGDTVRIAVAGAQPIHQPTTVGQSALPDRELTDINVALAQTSRAMQVWYPNGKLQSGVALEFGVLEVYRHLELNRNYIVTVGISVSSSVNDGEVDVRLRYTENASRPTTASPVVAERFYTPRVAGRWNDYEFSFIFQRDDTDGQDVKFLLTLARGTGQTTGTVATAGNQPNIRVVDAGPYTMPSGTDQNDGTVGGTSTAAATWREYRDTAAWSRSFRGNGAIRTDTTDMVQGYDPSGFNGDGKAMVGWPDLTSMLAGAVIQSVKVYLHNYHWYFNAGGTLVLGTHSQLSAPGSFSGTSNRVTVPYGREPSGQWIDVTAWASEFVAGTARGFVLGPSGGTNLTYYGRFTGAADTAHPDLRPELQIIYYK